VEVAITFSSFVVSIEVPLDVELSGYKNSDQEFPGVSSPPFISMCSGFSLRLVYRVIAEICLESTRVAYLSVNKVASIKDWPENHAKVFFAYFRGNNTGTPEKLRV
jgi:hypothetical protein